jgi:amino acid adenylation domain-containing protein
MIESFLVQQLLRASSKAYPDKDAVVSGNRRLKYSELDELSDKLSGTLRRLGVANGDRVGIYVLKSLASMVSIFAILKSGAAYVPLDLSAPPMRLAHIIRDSGAKVLLTNRDMVEEVVSMFPTDWPLSALVLVDCDPQSEGQRTGPSAPSYVRVVAWDEVLASPRPDETPTNMTENDIAYILYTSGSTGTPKGVMLSHRNCLTFANWAADCVGLSKNDLVSSPAPVHFDMSTFDIFSSILMGATNVLIPPEASAFPVELVKLIEREKISTWFSVPSVLTMMLIHGNIQGHDFSSLRTIIFAGEVFSTKHLRNLMTVLPKPRYFNWYGPTETNVCSYYEVPVLSPDRTTSIPIGRACSNFDVFAVDDQGKKVISAGVEGELYVRGPSVMMGYWGDSEKTERVLVKNPFNPLYDETVYKTGDIVTLDTEGNYLYLGRRDGMVKTRGFRVELGEIESTLTAHPSVKEAAAFAVPDDLLGNLIWAVIVPLESSNLTRQEILGFCGERLPKYMLPDHLEIRVALPKTSSGKIDRTALAKEVAT